jgi:hypothetical protein
VPEDDQHTHGSATTPADAVVPGPPRRFAWYTPETGFHWGEEPRPSGNQGAHAVWFTLTAPADIHDAGPEPDSEAHCELPTLDVDSEDVVNFDIVFSTGIQPAVVFVAGSPMPIDLLWFVSKRVAFDLELAGPDFGRWSDLASGSRYLLIQTLRARIRAVEESVRQALDDEVVSSHDYSALRTYPRRLALVERLWGELPEPTWRSMRAESHRYLVPLEIAVAGSAAEEAREAGARLSGLIASQSVVIAQRQAAQTERFQRLITIAGAAVLVPGLVAAVFGANVGFRGQQSSHGFWAMLLIMAGSALASYSYLRSRELDAWKKLLARLPTLGLSQGQGLAATGGVALIVIVAGVCVLLFG